MPIDTVRLICPNLRCRSILSVPTEARGKTVRCRQCGMRVRIPDSPAKPKPAEPAPNAAPQQQQQQPADAD